MRSTPAFRLVWTALVFSVPRLAAAQDAPKTSPLYVSLEYDAPDQCLSAREFKGIVKKRLGRDPFVEGSPNRVSALVSQGDGVLAGDVVWQDEGGGAKGQQHFPSTTNHCAQLIEAMAFALAVQIQLLEIEVEQKAKAASQDVSVAPATPEKSVPSAPEVPHPAPATASNRSPKKTGRSPTPFFGGGGGLAFGVSSHVAPAGRLFGGVRWTVLAIELGAEASAPVVTRRADGAGFSQWYLLANGAACALFEPLTVCALLKVGTVRVTGRDIDVPNGTGALLAQSGVRAALSQHLSSSVFLSLRGEALVNMTRWSVNLDHTPVWSSPPFAFIAGLDFTVLFQ